MFDNSFLVVLVAAVAGLVAAPFVMRLLRNLKSRQTISEHVPEGHQKKVGTPNMGGMIALIGAIVAIAIAQAPNWIAHIFLLLAYGLIGFIDDYWIPVRNPGSRGIAWKPKLLMQVGVGLIFLNLLTGDHRPDWVQQALALFLILFFTNAYNFSDGLDGLAGSLGLIICLTLSMLWAGVPDSLMLSLAGGLLAYLFVNVPPARVFMGDTGSLPIGSAIGYAVFEALRVAPTTEVPLWVTIATLILISGMMIAELVPVPMQIFWVKVFKKRLFPYTPIHHAFEKAGWPETRVTGVFVLTQLLLSIGALALLGANR